MRWESNLLNFYSLETISQTNYSGTLGVLINEKRFTKRPDRNPIAMQKNVPYPVDERYSASRMCHVISKYSNESVNRRRVKEGRKEGQRRESRYVNEWCNKHGYCCDTIVVSIVAADVLLDISPLTSMTTTYRSLAAGHVTWFCCLFIWWLWLAAAVKPRPIDAHISNQQVETKSMQQKF